MRFSGRLIISFVAAAAVSWVLAGEATAGVNPGLCRSTPMRASIPSNFGVDACFDGSALTLRDSTTLVIEVSKSGDVGNPSRTESDYGLAADAERLKSSDPNIFLPGDQLRFPVGAGSGSVSIRSSSDNGFYAIATTIAAFLPGKPNQVVGAFTALVSELDDDFTQYRTCLVGKNWLGQLGCQALLERNVTFAIGRAGISGFGKDVIGAVLSPATWAKWVSANVSDAAASLHDSGLIRISAAPRPSAPLTSVPSASGSGNASAATPSAGTTPVAAGQFPVQNASGGIYWRSSPDWTTAEASPGNGFYPGTVISVMCYQAGTANVPGSADAMWEQASWVSGRGQGRGWINEHFIADGSPINRPSPGVPPCAQTPSPSPSPAAAAPAPSQAVAQPSAPTPVTPSPASAAASPVVASPAATAPQTWSETVGGVAHTWTSFAEAGGAEGPSVASGQTVQVACAVPGFRVADGDTWWYRIASAPWDGGFYVSADAFYNDGALSGSLHGTPFVDPAVAVC